MNSSTEIKAGAKFFSFGHFEQAFERWKGEFYHPFRVASSETLRMPDGSTNDLFKYRYIVYHCAHYGAPRMRGVGKRPNQNYLPCGCRAMLRLNFSWSENALRITTLNAQHMGHEVSFEAFNRFSTKVRRPCSTTPSSTSSEPSKICTPPATPPTMCLSNHQKENESKSHVLVPLVPVSAPAMFPGKLESQVAPIDLSTDSRTDEQRFQELHAVLQNMTDHMLSVYGSEFDEKLRQMRLILKSWDYKLKVEV